MDFLLGCSSKSLQLWLGYCTNFSSRWWAPSPLCWEAQGLCKVLFSQNQSCFQSLYLFSKKISCVSSSAGENQSLNPIVQRDYPQTPWTPGLDGVEAVNQTGSLGLEAPGNSTLSTTSLPTFSQHFLHDPSKQHGLVCLHYLPSYQRWGTEAQFTSSSFDAAIDPYRINKVGHMLTSVTNKQVWRVPVLLQEEFRSLQAF